LKDLASCALVSDIKPNIINEAFTDDDFIIAMEEELHHSTRNDVWTLVPMTENKSIIRT